MCSSDLVPSFPSLALFSVIRRVEGGGRGREIREREIQEVREEEGMSLQRKGKSVRSRGVSILLVQ